MEKKNCDPSTYIFIYCVISLLQPCYTFYKATSNFYNELGERYQNRACNQIK